MKYQGQTFETERALYAVRDAEVDQCTFISEIGESPLKEARNIQVSNSRFLIRYPFWHNQKTSVTSTYFGPTCRAPFWYDEEVSLSNCTIEGVKAFREASKIKITESKITSEEFGWFLHDVLLSDVILEGMYAFFGSTNLEINNLTFKGKYSFQYVKNAVIKNANLDTKDAFWHTENVTVIDSVINGEYLGWYAKNLRLINCVIKGTQPLCYSENVILENCQMLDADLAFEYSSVEADIKSEMISIKNPLTGHIRVKKVGEIILDENRRDENLEITEGEVSDGTK